MRNRDIATKSAYEQKYRKYSYHFSSARRIKCIHKVWVSSKYWYAECLKCCKKKRTWYPECHENINNRLKYEWRIEIVVRATNQANNIHFFTGIEDHISDTTIDHRCRWEDNQTKYSKGTSRNHLKYIDKSCNAFILRSIIDKRFMEAILIIVEKYWLIFLDHGINFIINHGKIFDLSVTLDLNKYLSWERIILLVLNDTSETRIALLKIRKCRLTRLILHFYWGVNCVKLSHKYLQLAAFLDDFFLEIDWERESLTHSSDQDVGRMFNKQKNTRKKSNKHQNKKRRKRKEGVSPNISKRIDKYSHTELKTNREVIVFNWEEKSKGKLQLYNRLKPRFYMTKGYFWWGFDNSRFLQILY